MCMHVYTNKRLCLGLQSVHLQKQLLFVCLRFVSFHILFFRFFFLFRFITVKTVNCVTDIIQKLKTKQKRMRKRWKQRKKWTKQTNPLEIFIVTWHLNEYDKPNCLFDRNRKKKRISFIINERTVNTFTSQSHQPATRLL